MDSQDSPKGKPEGRVPITVVIADDHPITREGTRQILEADPGIQVVGEAADGAELVTLVERMSPDVAMVDISMPEMNGIEATKRVKALRPTIAVLIVSAYDDDRYVFAALAAGAAGYLLKDASARTLTRAVHQVHAGEPVLHPEIAKKVLARVAQSDESSASNSHASALTDREQQTLRLAARGMSNAEIARSLSVSIRTVQAHLTQTFGKLGVGSRTEAVIAGLRSGLLTMEDLDDD